MHQLRVILVVGLVAAGLATGCAVEDRTGTPVARAEEPAAVAPATQPSEAASLYERIGGQKAIRAIVDDFVDRALADPKVNFARKGTPDEWEATPRAVGHVKSAMVNWFSEAAGGPQRYRGRNMQAVHRGMRISGPEFQAAARDFQAALEKQNVSPAEQEEMMKIFNSPRNEIIQASPK